MKANKNHHKFIQLVAEGEQLKNAYSLSYPNKNLTKGTIAVESSKLAKLYAKEIELEKKKVSDIIEASQKKTIAKIEEKRIMTIAERMEWLSKVALGEIRVKQPFVIAGKIMEYPAEPSINDRKAAIAELNKMDGSYTPIKQDITTQGEKLTTWVMSPAQKK